MPRSEASRDNTRRAARERMRMLRSTPEGRARLNAQKRAWYAEHRDRIAEEWASRSPEARRDAYLQRTYGITAGEYDELLAAQGGGCAICGGIDPGNSTRCAEVLHVDHDHVTGVIRGLLCGPCNRALGQAGDDPDRLLAMAVYLLRKQDVLQLANQEA